VQEEITMIELHASAPEGRRLVAIAEELAGSVAGEAGRHDHDGSYPFEGLETVRRSGYLVAAIPAELGGLGVRSVHDLVVAAGRRARGDASLAIGVNMHTDFVLNVVRAHRAARARGDEARAAGFERILEWVGRDGIVVAAAVSEHGQDLTRPGTTGVRTETGWRIDGRKVFCTMSPAATTLLTAVRFDGRDDEERYGYALVPAGAPGVTIENDWDALGMRASGSHSVTFEAVEVPESALLGGFRVGDTIAYVRRNLTAGLFHASSSLGIAEGAADHIRSKLAQRPTLDSRSRMLLAAIAVDLAACRAMLARAARLVDDHDADDAHSGRDAEVVLGLFAEAQAAKTFVNEAATRVVDHALALSGGAGYLNGSLIARAYRDVRAGAFMHPLGANRAYDVLADASLGREATLR
jgi:alkylation response protein AidB-like acyl-CoA dehydrogenase